MNTFSKKTTSVIPQIIGDKTVNANYSGPDGAIALADRLTEKDYDQVPMGERGDLILGARLNVYYSAAGYYNSLGGKKRFLGVYYLYKAKKLADSFYLLSDFHYAPQMFLFMSPYPGIVQQCQATYRAWAMVKSKFRLPIKTEWGYVLALEKAVSQNKYATYQLKALALAVIYTFPGAKGSDVGMAAYRKVIDVINKLNDKVAPSKEESQTLSRLLCAVDRVDQAAEVATKANLPDQIAKARG